MDQLFDEVMAIAARLRQSAVAGHQSPGLSLPACGVLKLLQQHSGLTVPQLARHRGTSRQNIQVLVDRLAGAGLVGYVTNPDHQRSERVQLTETGKRSLTSANRRQATRLAGILSQVTEEELRSCGALLGRIRGKLGGSNPARRPPVVSTRKQRKRAKNPPPAAAVETSVGFPQESPPDASPLETLPVNLL